MFDMRFNECDSQNECVGGAGNRGMMMAEKETETIDYQTDVEWRSLAYHTRFIVHI